ncbi:MAG: prephenate dehydrogenase [Anaerolineaceae bacterium]
MAILGLGLMGGSLALALKGKCASLLGIDPDPAAVKLAVENQIVDLAATDPASLLPTADLIVLAAPVRAIIALLSQIPNHHPTQAVVLDLGSTKSDILTAMELLPDRFDPIGGHPICGKEQASLAFADGRLFQGAAFVLSPLTRTSARARQAAVQLVLAAGARPLWMEASIHDRMVAATSHFPYILANALAAATPLEAAPLTGPGFQSMTRLASSSPEMMRDILMTNKDNILSSLKTFQIQLSRMEGLLSAGDFENLGCLLKEGAENKENIYVCKGAFL